MKPPEPDLNPVAQISLAENGWRWKISKSQRGRFGKCYWRKNKATRRKVLAFGRPKRTLVGKLVLLSGSPLPNSNPDHGTTRIVDEDSVSSMDESKHLSEDPQPSRSESLKDRASSPETSHNAPQTLVVGPNLLSSGAELGVSKELELEKALVAQQMEIKGQCLPEKISDRIEALQKIGWNSVFAIDKVKINEMWNKSWGGKDPSSNSLVGEYSSDDNESEDDIDAVVRSQVDRSNENQGQDVENSRNNFDIFGM